MGRMRLFTVWGVLALLLVAAYGEANLGTDAEREEVVATLDDDILSDRALTTVTCRYVTFGVAVRRARVNGASIRYNFNANPQRGTFRFTADRSGGFFEFILKATNPLFPNKCVSVSDSGFLLSCRSSRPESPWHNFGTSLRSWAGRRVNSVSVENPGGLRPVCATYKTENSSIDSTFEMEERYFSNAERIWSPDQGNLVVLIGGVGSYENPNPPIARKPGIVDDRSLRQRFYTDRLAWDKKWRDDAKVAVHRDTLVVNWFSENKGILRIYRRSRVRGWQYSYFIEVPRSLNSVATRLIGRKIHVRWNALMVLGYDRIFQRYWAYMCQRESPNSPFQYLQRVELKGNQPTLGYGAFQPNIALLARWMVAQTSPTAVSIFKRSGNGLSSVWRKVGQTGVRMRHAQPWVLGASTNWVYDWGGTDKIQWNRERELVVANQKNKQVRVFFENASGNWVEKHVVGITTKQSWSNPRMFRTNWAHATYEEFLFCTADVGYGRFSEFVYVFRKNLSTNRYITTPSQNLRPSDSRVLNIWRSFGNRMAVEDGVLLLSDNGGDDVAIHVFVLNRDTRQWTFFKRLQPNGSERPVQVQSVGYAHPNYAFAMVNGRTMGWYVPVIPPLPCRPPNTDICFAMDRSSSIGSAYQAQKDFIMVIVDSFEVSSGWAVYKYGAVSFTHITRTISTLTTSASEFSRQVNNHPGPDGRTNLLEAMKGCNRILSAGSGALKIFVLITDGKGDTSNSDLISLATRIKRSKKIITVDVGNSGDRSLLRNMASRDTGDSFPLYLHVTRPSQFANFVPELADDVCRTF